MHVARNRPPTSVPKPTPLDLVPIVIILIFFLGMGRSYKKKVPKRDPLVLRRAVAAMKMGMSLRTASREFDVPRSTLLLHRRNNENNNEQSEPPQEVNIDQINIVTKGFKTVITESNYF